MSSPVTAGGWRACFERLAGDRDAAVRRETLDLLLAWQRVVPERVPLATSRSYEALLPAAIARWRGERDATGLAALGRSFSQLLMRGPAWVVLLAWWSEALVLGLLFALWFGAWRLGLRRSPPPRPLRALAGAFVLLVSWAAFCTPVATALREPWAAYYLPKRWVGGLPFTAAALLSVAGCCALGVLWGLIGQGDSERTQEQADRVT